jgi:nitrite reductase (NADH) small subunit
MEKPGEDGGLRARIRVCSEAELGAPGVRTVLTPSGQIAVFRLADGRLAAIEDRCPHRGALLSAGAVYDGDKVACLDHGWTIRLTDGCVEPPEQGCVRTFPVEVVEGSVFVSV